MLLAPALILASYLLGSISTAVITCRLMGLPDPRGLGSGNPGATNVLRMGARKAAVITLLGDMLKGMLPVGIAHAAGIEGAWLGAVALAAFIGHLYPLYHGFRGGKGVATALGILLALHWAAGIAALVTWLLTAAVTRISSLSALVAALLSPLFVHLSTGDHWLTGAVLVMSALVYWRHRRNLANLLAAKEPRIGHK
jgi:acyl phosphate:glycerol-3-phosphate acyltransferase